MAIAGAGCLVFAAAPVFEWLWIGRALVGVGFAAGLMAPFAMYRTWFAPHHQKRLAAWTERDRAYKLRRRVWRNYTWRAVLRKHLVPLLESLTERK